MAIVTRKKRYWGVVAPVPADMLAQIVKQQEAIGLEGTFAAQVYGPPFIPLAATAAVTTRLLLASGIAMAFVRSPFETAMAALDLDRLSGGRFILGLGSGIRAWSEGFFGMPYGKPVEHLREAVEVIRLLLTKSHTGELQGYHGKYYHLDFSVLQDVEPPIRPHLPIWIAALRGRLVQLGAEIADGVIGHPIWSIKWATTTMPDQLKAGLARGGKQRADVHVNDWFWVTPNTDTRQSIEDARACVAFYAGMEQNEEYFAAHGFRAECKRLQEGVKRRDYRSVAHLVPDDMARTFVVTGTPDEVRQQLEPVWEFADSLCLIPPMLSLDPAQVEQYETTIAETFYQ